ncbi:hypothetical protein [Rhodohalobacter sp. 614A]|uniref:hypothetical protein n=1 Tax=Rhodohalobacter sp. 614A TaxID=2908649 RepID=UPI001F3CCC3E|nr:hypothetical protein [Rhodohalobacter sp. 614A]
MNPQKESLSKRLVNYSLEFEGKFYIIENVPARVNEETGEQYFSPETVEHIRKTITSHSKPKKTIETPVFDYSD